MRKTFSITNKIVEKEFEDSNNASELLEVMTLYYRGDITKQYVETYRMVQEANKMLKRTKK
ncbi:MAG: hypothetical protein AB9856_20950 [Cellulosilyticaceae bacterium]